MNGGEKVEWSNSSSGGVTVKGNRIVRRERKRGRKSRETQGKERKSRSARAGASRASADGEGGFEAGVTV